MTCGHCARAVVAELNTLDAVTEMTVDLGFREDNSVVTVAASTDMPPDIVRDAIGRAGYELVGTPS